MPGKQAVQHAGSQRVAPAAVTISESELYTLRKEAESPIATRKPVVSMQRDVQEGKKRAEFMRQHDMEALRKKAESGALEGEAVEAIAKKLGWSIRSAA